MKRIVVFAAGMAAGIAAVIAIVALTGWPLPFTTSHEHGEPAHAARTAHGHDGPERIALSETQIRDAGITLAEAKGGTLKRHFLAPGSLIPDADHIAASRCAWSPPSPN